MSFEGGSVQLHSELLALSETSFKYWPSLAFIAPQGWGWLCRLPTHALYDNSSNNGISAGTILPDISRRHTGVIALLNPYMEKIIQESRYKHHSDISICGKPFTNLRFADHLGSSNNELQYLTNRLVASASGYGLGVSAENQRLWQTAETTLS